MRRAYKWKGAKDGKSVTITVIVSTTGFPEKKTTMIGAEMCAEAYARVKRDFATDDIHFKP